MPIRLLRQVYLAINFSSVAQNSPNPVSTDVSHKRMSIPRTTHTICASKLIPLRTL